MAHIPTAPYPGITTESERKCPNGATGSPTLNLLMEGGRISFTVRIIRDFPSPPVQVRSVRITGGSHKHF